MENVKFIGTVNFKGITSPYTNKNGFKVTPIAQNPSQEEINRAMEAAQGKKLGEGFNGRAYCYGEDLVVKKYKPKEEALIDDTKKEVRALDELYENGIKSKYIQEGKYAFETPEGQLYLVSSRLKGAKPDARTNPFNFQNLSRTIEAITELDTPKVAGKLSSINFPIKVECHYDLLPGNILIDKENAGIIDFEYSKLEDMQGDYTKAQINDTDTNCSISDIPGILSNLRGFEYRTLIKYLRQVKNPKEAENIFKSYLGMKANYHNKMAQMYGSIAQESGNEPCLEVAKKNKNHAGILKKAAYDENYSDVAKAEAMKIQMARFIYVQSEFSKDIEEPVNVRQIKDYSYKLQYDFKENYKKAIENNDPERAEYYLDCVKIMDFYAGVRDWMDWQLKDHEKEDWMSDDYFEHLKENKELLLEKLSPNPQPTLDEIVRN